MEEIIDNGEPDAVTQAAPVYSAEGDGADTAVTPSGVPVTRETDTDGNGTEETVKTVEETPTEIGDAVDYEALAAEDLAEIRRIAPEAGHVSHLSELPNATRYAALRDAGLTVEEAFWAACHGNIPARGAEPYDNRAHLRSAVPRGAAGNPAYMSAAEMSAAKELFGDLTDAEIQKLYSKCRA